MINDFASRSSSAAESSWKAGAVLARRFHAPVTEADNDGSARRPPDTNLRPVKGGAINVRLSRDVTGHLALTDAQKEKKQ